MKQDRFNLIVGMMSNSDAIRIVFASNQRKEIVAGMAGGGFGAGTIFGRQCSNIDGAQRDFQPPRQRRIRHETGIIGSGSAAQTVIEGGDMDRKIEALAQRRKQMHEGERVRATGNADDEPRASR